MLWYLHRGGCPGTGTGMGPGTGQTPGWGTRYRYQHQDGAWYLHLHRDGGCGTGPAVGRCSGPGTGRGSGPGPGPCSGPSPRPGSPVPACPQHIPAPGLGLSRPGITGSCTHNGAGAGSRAARCCCPRWDRSRSRTGAGGHTGTCAGTGSRAPWCCPYNGGVPHCCGVAWGWGSSEERGNTLGPPGCERGAAGGGTGTQPVWGLRAVEVRGQGQPVPSVGCGRGQAARWQHRAVAPEEESRMERSG